MCPPPLPLRILLWNPPLLTLLILIRLHQNHEIHCCYQNNYGARCTVVLDKCMQLITAWCFIVLLQKHKIFTLIWFDSIRLTHVIWYNDIYSLIVVHLIWLLGRFDSLWRELISCVLIWSDVQKVLKFLMVFDRMIKKYWNPLCFHRHRSFISKKTL